MGQPPTGFKCNDLMTDDPNLFCSDLDSVIHALKTFRNFGKLAGLNHDKKKSKAAFSVLP